MSIFFTYDIRMLALQGGDPKEKASQRYYEKMLESWAVVQTTFSIAVCDIAVYDIAEYPWDAGAHNAGKSEWSGLAVALELFNKGEILGNKVE